MKNFNSGKWNPIEVHIYEKNFNKLINKKITYKELSYLIQTRSSLQIRSHHQKVYNKVSMYANILISLKK